MRKVLFVDLEPIEEVAYTDGDKVLEKLEKQRFVYTTDIKCINKDVIDNYTVILRKRDFDTLVLDFSESKSVEMNNCNTIDDVLNLALNARSAFKPTSSRAYASAIMGALSDLKPLSGTKEPTSVEDRNMMSTLGFMILYNTDLQNVFK